MMMPENGLQPDDSIWYEAYPPISRALKLLRPLPDYVQELFGKHLHAYAKELSYVHPRTQSSVSKYDADGQLEGLNRLRHFMQNKAHHTMVAKALNEIMSLSEKGRNMVGQRMLLGLKALDNMAQDSPEGLAASHQQRLQVHALVQAVFSEDVEQFQSSGPTLKEKREAEAAEAEAIQAQALLFEARRQMQEQDEGLLQDDFMLNDGFDDEPEADGMAPHHSAESLRRLFNPVLVRVGKMLTFRVEAAQNNEDAAPASFEEQLKTRGKARLREQSVFNEDESTPPEAVNASEFFALDDEESAASKENNTPDLNRRIIEASEVANQEEPEQATEEASEERPEERPKEIPEAAQRGEEIEALSEAGEILEETPKAIDEAPPSEISEDAEALESMAISEQAPEPITEAEAEPELQTEAESVETEADAEHTAAFKEAPKPKPEKKAETGKTKASPKKSSGKAKTNTKTNAKENTDGKAVASSKPKSSVTKTRKKKTTADSDTPKGT